MLLTAVIFFLILSVLILVHELGHFLTAKKLGIKVEEFGFGLPPRIFGVKKGETLYSLNWLPIGGFVKLFGEEGETDLGGKNPKSPEAKNRAFYARPVWQRALVLVAGVSMNFILALVVLTYLFTQGVMVPTDRVHIQKVIENSPAAAVGLKENDIIKSMKIKNAKGIDETVEIKNADTLSKTTKDHLGEQILLTVVRSTTTMEFVVTPRKDFPKDQGPMGIIISNYEEKKYTLLEAPILGMKEAFGLSFDLLKGITKTVWKMVTFQSVQKDVAGPLGIAQMTGEAVKSGEAAVLELLGLLSLNLAIVNILPFPALDGGRLLFVVIEGITGKKVKTKYERTLHQIGMIVLLSLMLLVTLNDILRLFTK